MDIFIKFLIAFAVGGSICVLGQLLINFTKMTSARILVIFLLLGVILEACGVFEPIKMVANAGITIPITGFGSTLAKGAIKGAKEKGLLGAVTGKGWTEGVQLMSVGDKYKFYLPASLAYGEQGAGQDIKPGAALVFEIELVSIQ